MTLEEAIALAKASDSNPPQRFPLPSELEVDAIAGRAGAAVHPDFKTYLLQASNLAVGYLEPVCLHEASTQNYFWSVLEDARAAGIPDGHLPLCEDNGDFYLIAGEGRVRFWSHDGAVEEEWSDLAAWIEEVWVGGE